jgi:hypothetical protein
MRARSRTGSTHKWLVFLAFAALFALACEESKELTVSGVDPKKGKYLGGDQVAVTGTGFKTSGFKVYFGGKPAGNCIVASTTRIQCDTPAGPKDQTVDVEVVFDDARSKKLEKAFTYYDPIGEGPTNAVPTLPQK